MPGGEGLLAVEADRECEPSIERAPAVERPEPEQVRTFPRFSLALSLALSLSRPLVLLVLVRFAHSRLAFGRNNSPEEKETSVQKRAALRKAESKTARKQKALDKLVQASPSKYTSNPPLPSWLESDRLLVIPGGSSDLSKAKKLLLHNKRPKKGKLAELYDALQALREAHNAEADAAGKLTQVDQALSDAGARLARRKGE